MGLFKEIKGKTGSGTGRFFREGTFVARVDRVFVKESKRKKGTTYTVVEVTVLQSSREDTGVGAKKSWSVNMTGDWPELALGNVADFIYSACCSMADAEGEDRPERDEVCEDSFVEHNVVGEANVLAGAVLHLDVVEIDKTHSDSKFSRHDWSVPEDLENWVKAAAAA